MENENHFENEGLGVSFELPEKMTVRQQIAVRARVWDRNSDEPAALRFWFGMLPMIENWQCDDYPDPFQIDIDEETDVTVTQIITWASNQMAGYFYDKGMVPKVL